MSAAGAWPGGAGGALSLTFDNLGEAAEVELGAIEPGAALGGHPSVEQALPAVLEALERHGLAATFFIEGLNAELYPQALSEIARGGHEVAYHAWRHERWAELDGDAQAANLTRGVEALDKLGLRVAGMRPPGGGLGAGGLSVLREAGLSYCSPAGRGVGAEDGMALLPFQWRHVDAACVLPALAPVREQMVGSGDALDPQRFLSYLEGQVDELAREGGYAALVLHPFMLGWLGEERLDALLAMVSSASARGEVWVGRCIDAAGHVLSEPGTFPASGAALDPTSWDG